MFFDWTRPGQAHKRKTSEIGEYRSIAILAVEPEHCAFW
jgi:hypothetical protein